MGRHDNFFELGGHSLLAVTLIERMRQQGLQAEVRTLFATPTLAELAAAVCDGERRGSRCRANRIPAGCEDDHAGDAAAGGAAARRRSTGSWRRCRAVRRNVQDIYPLAPLQEGILFHHLMGERGRSVPAADRAGFRHAGAAGRVSGGAAGGDRPARHPAHGGGVGGTAGAGAGGVAAGAAAGGGGGRSTRRRGCGGAACTSGSIRGSTGSMCGRRRCCGRTSRMTRGERALAAAAAAASPGGAITRRWR